MSDYPTLKQIQATRAPSAGGVQHGHPRGKKIKKQLIRYIDVTAGKNTGQNFSMMYCPCCFFSSQHFFSVKEKRPLPRA